MNIVISVFLVMMILMLAMFAYVINLLIAGAFPFIGVTLIMIDILFYFVFYLNEIYLINNRYKKDRNSNDITVLKQSFSKLVLIGILRIVTLSCMFIFYGTLTSSDILWFYLAFLGFTFYLTFEKAPLYRKIIIESDNNLMIDTERELYGNLLYRGRVNYISGGKLASSGEIWLRISDSGLYYGDEFVSKEEIIGVEINSNTFVNYTSSTSYSTLDYIALGNYAFINPKTNTKRHVETISKLIIHYVDNGRQFGLVLGGNDLNEVEYQIRSMI